MYAIFQYVGSDYEQRISDCFTHPEQAQYLLKTAFTEKEKEQQGLDIMYRYDVVNDLWTTEF